MKINNKKAKFDYFLSNNLEVGLVLHSPEVKAIVNGHISLRESYVKIINNEVWLINAHVSEMKFERFDKDVNPLRDKKLLLHKKQINKFKRLLQENGTTLLLIEVYSDDNGRLKGTLSLGKGKKLYDKRNVIKERDLKRKEI